jgi:prepilin-type N-terminal cleavage/methylation domain-containing protein/prepilin-type processing-associated H-X9-DG protein
MKRGKGFTLIELLVVIAIIAILAAMIFPVFSRARAAARKARCISNLKNLTLAMLMYADEFDGKLYWASCQPEEVIVESWYSNVVFESYVKNQQVKKCPNAGNGGEIGNQTYFTPDVDWYPGYGTNWYLESMPGGYAIDRARRPDRVFLVADCVSSRSTVGCNPAILAQRGTVRAVDYYGNGASTVHPDITPDTHIPNVAYANACAAADPSFLSCPGIPDFGVARNPAFQTSDWTRHEGGSNLAFLDGHVKYLAADKITWGRLAGDPFPGYNPNW